MAAARPTSILDLIGNTPLLDLALEHEGEPWRLFAKAEFMNPSGSVKDRIAKYIIEKAEERGELGPGSLISEATSGNTGIGLAMVAGVKGYPLVIAMPEHMSLERQKIMVSLGARLCLTPKQASFAGSREKTREMAAKNPKVFLPRQFENPDNTLCHYHTTGREILKQMEGSSVDAFVDGVGTGGTLMGVGQAMKEVWPHCQVVAVEPDEAAILSGEREMHDHKIAGIGDGFIPELLDTRQVDCVIRVKSDEAVAMAKRLSREFGLMVGVSSGANVLASIAILRSLGKGKNVVTVLPDRAERYFSTDLFARETSPGKVCHCSPGCEDPFCCFLLDPA